MTDRTNRPTEPTARDRVVIEAIEDDRRIFQALCTERDRLSRLLGYDPEHIDRDRAARLTATREHTERLIRVYADRLADLPHTDDGCACIVLASLYIHPCRDHAPEATKSGRAVDPSYRLARPAGAR